MKYVRPTHVGTLAASLLAVLAASLQAQQPAATRLQTPGPSAASPVLKVVGNIDYIEQSDVASLREGVIKQMEFNVGDLVEEGQIIGVLHDEYARLKVARGKVAAESAGSIQRAEAMLRSEQLQMRIKENADRIRPGTVTLEERSLKEILVEAAKAELQAAYEAQSLALAELAMAERELEEHTIHAPFTGYVTDRMKNAGESVQLNEPVLKIGRIDKLRVLAHLDVAAAHRIREGDLVEVRPIIDDIAEELPIERRVFRGKVTAIGREVSSVVKTVVQIWAEVDNPRDATGEPGIGMQILANMKCEMSIQLGSTQPAVAPAAALGSALPTTATSR